MYTRECIRCETFFDCVGKEKDKPCLHFKDRKKEPEIGFETILQKEMKGLMGDGSKFKS